MQICITVFFEVIVLKKSESLKENSTKYIHKNKIKSTTYIQLNAILFRGYLS